MKMNESPAFQKMKEEGKTSKAPLTEAFGQWKNAKIALLALFGAVAGQAVVWYSGQFYALFFLQNVLKVDAVGQYHGRHLAAIGTGFFVVFGWLSDKIGRKPIIMAGLLLAAHLLPAVQGADLGRQSGAGTGAGNVRAKVTPRRGTAPSSSIDGRHGEVHDVVRYRDRFLTRNSVPYDVVTAAPGTVATVTIGNDDRHGYDSVAAGDQAKGLEMPSRRLTNIALHDAGYPLKRGAAKVADQKLDAFVAANPELNLDAAAIRAGEKKAVPLDQAVSDKLLTAEEAAGATECHVYSIPAAGAFTMVADPAAVNWPKVIAILFVLVIYVTMVYGPIAAILVEMFPTRIRYTGMSLPYHIGNGWFGGLLPATVPSR
jgi:hypothetical protein